MKSLIRINLIIFALFTACPAYACRFWAGVGENISQNAIDQLLKQPKALKVLGKDYQDGWSVGYYNDSLKPIVWRGALASNNDLRFDRAVQSVSMLKANIVFSHLRRASSGCVEDVPNPHPFEIERNGVTWLFGHNGGMKKQILIDLIGKKYLNDNPPIVCTEKAPDSWIDSELYFVFLMKSIEENSFNVELGIQQGLKALYQVIPEDQRYLNFFLTDGSSIWAFRKGTSLYYRYDDRKKESFITSTIPQEKQGDWKEFPEYTLATLKPNQKIVFNKIK